MKPHYFDSADIISRRQTCVSDIHRALSGTSCDCWLLVEVDSAFVVELLESMIENHKMLLLKSLGTSDRIHSHPEHTTDTRQSPTSNNLILRHQTNSRPTTNLLHSIAAMP